MKKLLLLALLATPAFAQHTFCPVDGNCEWTGTHTFDNPITAPNVVTQTQQTSGASTASAVNLNGDPLPTSTGSISIGGTTGTCPGAITGSPTTCIKASIGGSPNYYWIPAWVVSSTDTDYPTVPTTATTFSNLQNATGNPGTWTICNAATSCSAGTPSCVGSATNTFGVTSPSLSGSTFRFDNITSSGSPTGCDTLNYHHLGSSWSQDTGGGTNTLASLTNAYEDVWVYTVPGANIVGYEFDPDFFVGNAYTTKASIACYTNGGGTWYVYNQSGNLPTGGAWASTPYACNWNSTGANAWHHIQLWVSIDQSAHTYTYKLLVADGTKLIAQSLANTITYNSWAHNGGNTLNIEQQIDNNSTAGTSTAYYDKETLKVW